MATVEGWARSIGHGAGRKAGPDHRAATRPLTKAGVAFTTARLRALFLR